MKIVSHSKSFYSAMDKIPEAVAVLAAEYHDNTVQYFRQTVRWFTPGGSLYSMDTHLVDEDDILDHVKKAKKRSDCTILVSPTLVEVRRNLSSGDYIIAEYVPITE